MRHDEYHQWQLEMQQVEENMKAVREELKAAQERLIELNRVFDEYVREAYES